MHTCTYTGQDGRTPVCVCVCVCACARRQATWAVHTSRLPPPPVCWYFNQQGQAESEPDVQSLASADTRRRSWMLPGVRPEGKGMGTDRRAPEEVPEGREAREASREDQARRETVEGDGGTQRGYPAACGVSRRPDRKDKERPAWQGCPHQVCWGQLAARLLGTPSQPALGLLCALVPVWQARCWAPHRGQEHRGHEHVTSLMADAVMFHRTVEAGAPGGCWRGSARASRQGRGPRADRAVSHTTAAVSWDTGGWQRPPTRMARRTILMEERARLRCRPPQR